MRNIVISLGITTLSSVLLYMYFKHKMADVENKVEIMFQLIQEHAAANDAALRNVNSQHNSPTFSLASRSENIKLESPTSLVDVSDDEDNDSDEVSDSDEESDEEDIDVSSTTADVDIEELDVRESLFQEDDTKKINFNIRGSETDSLLDLNNLEDLTTNHNGSDLEEEELDDNGVVEEIKFDDMTNVNLELNEITLSEKEDVVQVAEAQEDTNKTLKILAESFDSDSLRKRTVAQLKEIAAQRNLQKYKSLTKKRLIELISNSQ
jgi:hypothetical protein